MTHTLRCNQLPANCTTSPVHSETAQECWRNPIKPWEAQAHPHLSRSLRKRQRLKGPSGKGRALGKPSRCFKREVLRQTCFLGGFLGGNTDSSHPCSLSTPSLVVAAPSRQQRAAIPREQQLFVEIVPERQQRGWNLNYCPCCPACPGSTLQCLQTDASAWQFIISILAAQGLTGK